MKAKKKTKKAKLKIKENRVQEFLNEIGMSQQELADNIHTSRHHVSEIARQKRPQISAAIAIRIAKHLNKKVEEVFIVEEINVNEQ